MWNERDEPATIMMWAAQSSVESCYYPDSRNVLVDPVGTLVRSEPDLDYYDGEGAEAAVGVPSA